MYKKKTKSIKIKKTYGTNTRTKQAMQKTDQHMFTNDQIIIQILEKNIELKT